MDGKTETARRDTTHLMVHGHEPWLEMATSHGHAGGIVEVYVKWGHNMQTDGLVRKEELKAFAINPGGKQEELALADGGPEHYTLRIYTPADGFYHVVARNTGDYVLDKESRYHPGTRREYPEAAHAIHYVQCAHAFVPVGHNLEGVPSQAGTELEMVPDIWKQWRAGDRIALQVLLRGQPLNISAVDVACDGPRGYQDWMVSADENGRIKLEVSEPGRYLVVARHQVQERGEGVYDLLSLTATLGFIVTR